MAEEPIDKAVDRTLAMEDEFNTPAVCRTVRLELQHEGNVPAVQDDAFDATQTRPAQREGGPDKVKALFYEWINTNRVMLLNAGSLVCTTVVTGVFGFAYWWIAARQFPPQAVGLASAAVSAMMVLGAICILGLGTLLIGELPRHRGKEASLISAALIVVGATGACGGIIFALVAPLVSIDFLPFRANIGAVLLFATGASLTTITIVLDEALIGLMKGALQLWRNALFAIVKLVALAAAGFWLVRVGETIYGTWVLGLVLSLAPFAALVVLKVSRSGRSLLPDWQLLRKLRFSALKHHMLNLILQVPATTLPLVVTIVLSATANAWFYVAWMIAGFVFIASFALTTVLYAINAGQSAELTRKIRVTLSLALITCVLANCLLQIGATPILSFFGRSYAEHATWPLRILALGAFPVIVKHHFVAVSRIHGNMTRVAVPVALGSLLELGVAALGAHFGGLVGLSLGWVAAVCVEAAFMFPAVYRAAFPAHASPRRHMKRVLATRHNAKTGVESERG